MSVRTHMRERESKCPSGPNSISQHRSTAERVPVLPALFPKKHERERTPPSPTPPASPPAEAVTTAQTHSRE